MDLRLRVKINGAARKTNLPISLSHFVNENGRRPRTGVSLTQKFLSYQASKILPTETVPCGLCRYVALFMI
jgi:hypothetical protein